MIIAVFLDRDGTINKDPGYFHDASKLEIFDGVIEGLKLLSKNYKFFVIQNQAGIGKGIYKEKDRIEVNEKINEILAVHNLRIEKFYYCPHREEDNCECRKPKADLVLRAVKEFNIDLEKSWLIGDTTIDAKLGENLKNLGFRNFRMIQLKTGYAGMDRRFHAKPDFIANNLLEAAKIIQEH